MVETSLRRRTVLGAGLAASVGGLTLAAPRIARAAGAPVRIGWLVALTGPNSSPGIGFDRGIHFGLDEVNQAGGGAGRQLELITRDTQGDPTKAVNAALEVINQQKVEFLLGPTNSGESMASEPVTARYKTPSLVYSVVDNLVDAKKYPYFFRQLPSNTQWTAAAQDYVLKVLKAKKVAVLADATGYGTATLDLAINELKKTNVPVSYSGLIDPNQTDVTADIQKAKASGAEAMLVWSDSAGLNARLMNARGDAGWDAPMIGHPALGTGIVKSLLKKPDYWDKVYLVGYRSTSYDANGKLPARTQAFMEKLNGKVKLSDTTLWWVACGYDSVQLIKYAVEHGGAASPDAIRKAWESLKSFPGIFGDYSYTATDHNGYPTAEIVMNAANSFKDGAYAVAPGY
jgi:branched-chain amino acid transport system substrate-binding protein